MNMELDPKTAADFDQQTKRLFQALADYLDVIVGSLESINVNSLNQLSTAKKTVTNPAAATNILIAAANPNRKAFTVYNNSTNSLYGGVEPDVSGGNQIFQLGSNAGTTAYWEWWGPCVYTGAIYARRNTGTGAIVVWEFE